MERADNEKEIDEMAKMFRDLLAKIRGITGKGTNDQPEKPQPDPSESKEPEQDQGSGDHGATPIPRTVER